MITPQPLQPLGIGDIIDRSIKLYKVNFLKFISIIVVPQVVVFLASVVMLFATFQPFGKTGFDLSRLIFLLPAFSIGLIGWWLKLIAMGAMVRIISEYYLGRVISVKEALSFIMNKWVTLLGAIILSSIFTFFGFLLLIIPGIYLLLSYIFVIPVVSIENSGVWDSLKRSSFLSKGFKIKAILIGICYAVLVYILTALISLPFLFIGFSGLRTGAPMALPLQIAQNFLQQMLQMLFTPFWMVALTLLYYDSRIRKEGFDLQIMSQQLGYEAPAPAAPAPYPPPAYQPTYTAAPVAPPPPAYAPAPSIPIPPPSPAPATPSPAPIPPLTLDFSPTPPLTPTPVPPLFNPPAPPTTAPSSSPEPSGAVFNPSPYGTKTCPKCRAAVPNVSPKCPKCGTIVPFKSGSVK